MADNFYIISGGPGAGKTILIDALGALGYITVPEAGRAILHEQGWVGGSAMQEDDRATYGRLMVARSIEAYLKVLETKRPVFFDRGLPELPGYFAYFLKRDVPAALRQAVDTKRYNRTVFLTPPWKAIYANDDKRTQDFAEATRNYEGTRRCYTEEGYAVIDVPRLSVDERVGFILEAISKE